MTGLIGPGYLGDEEIHLVLANTADADSQNGSAPSYSFQIRRLQDNQLLGGCTLRVSNSSALQYSGHISYAIAPAHRGHRYAAKAVRLLLPLAFRNGLPQVIIACRPDNAASRRTCLLAGGHFLGILHPPSPEIGQAGDDGICRYLFCNPLFTPTTGKTAEI
ncbi:MAG: GNAT family N-acetyltransferase [Oscillospiraceae bacterium]|nr:GNAT family N-acetyltransferase [Oscillospiraceae bacterium]